MSAIMIGTKLAVSDTNNNRVLIWNSLPTSTNQAPDVVIGHTQKVFVEPGDVVRKGRVFARANDQGAPDGCHLHFEVYVNGSAVNPMIYLP